MNLPASVKLALRYEDQSSQLLLRKESPGWKVEFDGDSFELAGSWIDAQRMRVELDEEIFEFPVLEDDDTVAINLGGHSYRFEIVGRKHASDSADGQADHPQAPMSGAVVALPVAVGDTVEPGATLMVIEAMKMEHAIVAQSAARVEELLFAVGDQVEEGDTLIHLEIE